MLKDLDQTLTAASVTGAGARAHDEECRQALLASISALARRRAYRLQNDIRKSQSDGYTELWHELSDAALGIEMNAMEDPAGPSFEHLARALHQEVFEGIPAREEERAEQDRLWAYAQSVIDFWEEGLGMRAQDLRENDPAHYALLMS